MVSTFVVEKKDKSWRFCVDCRQLNKVTKMDAYPLSRTDESLDALAGSSWFSTLALVSGYWQCEVYKKLHFQRIWVFFQFKVLSFGISIALVPMKDSWD